MRGKDPTDGFGILSSPQSGLGTGLTGSACGSGLTWI